MEKVVACKNRKLPSYNYIIMDDFVIKKQLEEFAELEEDDSLISWDFENMYDDYGTFRAGWEACKEFYRVNGDKNGTR